MLRMAIFSNEVSIISVNDGITYSQKNYPALVELFNHNYLKEVHRQLNIKKETNSLYLEDLKIMIQEFNMRIKNAKATELNDEEIEYENTLISAIAEISMLIAKLDVKMKFVFEKLGEKNEDNK